MLNRPNCRFATIIVASLAPALPVAPAAAQNDGSCCMPDGSWQTLSPYHCHTAGGIFQTGGETLNTPCDPLGPGIGMSQTAVRRLVREGVVHTLWISNPREFYEFEPTSNLWQLMAPPPAGYGLVVALQIPIDPRQYAGESITASAAQARLSPLRPALRPQTVREPAGRRHHPKEMQEESSSARTPGTSR